MKRIELFKKTGICITAFALSAMIGAANPMMTVLASDSENTTEEQSDDEAARKAAEEEAARKAAEEEAARKAAEEEAARKAAEEEAARKAAEEEAARKAAEEEAARKAAEEEAARKAAEEEAARKAAEEEAARKAAEEEAARKAAEEEAAKKDEENSNTGAGSTNAAAADTSNGGSTTAASGSTTSGTAASTASTATNSSTAGSSSTTAGTNSTTGGTNTAASSASDTAASAATTAAEATPSTTSETPASDTQTNQPEQTTDKTKAKETTLDPGETPTGYDQALAYTGSNADLIASQNIVSGLSIMRDNFRFFTIDKVPAVASKKQSVYEEMDKSSRKIGLLSKEDVLYVLSEEDDGWLYVESGNVRGFIKEDNISRGDDSASDDLILSFAEETVPASENKAFTFKRCTTKSTVVDKKYAIADTDASIMESTEDNPREIGHLAPGNLCYVLLQTDEKWSYVESGNVRGFVRTSNLTTGSAAKKIVQETGEVSMASAEEYIAPADNKALYYTLNSVKDGVNYSSIRTDIVEAAADCIGNPYVWGGTSLTNGADCSGFVQTLYAQFGYSLPRVADAQSRYGTQIPVSDAAPGDLIFFAANGYVYHVAMYAGDGMTIEAYSENRGIIATPIGNRDAVWATRVIED